MERQRATGDRLHRFGRERARSRARWLRRGAAWTPGLLFPLFFGAGCGPPPGAPALSELRCRSGAVEACQSRTDPFRLELAVDFEDPDGDLGAGLWQLFIDDAPKGERRALAPLFDESGVARDATAGMLALDVDLEPARVQAGEEVRVGVQVWDARLHESNRPAVRLRLELSP